MPLLNTASKMYVGSTPATAVYLGATKVWPSSSGPDPQVVWRENWEGWALGNMTVRPPVTALVGAPTIVDSFDGKAAESGPTSRKFSVSVAGMPHWSLDFTVRISGTQTANNYIAAVNDAAGTYIGELSQRLAEKQIWNRINFGADVTGRSVWTYTDPSIVRIVYEWKDDEFLKAHLFYGANLNGTTPDESLLFDKTMAAGILVGKRAGEVRFGNDSSSTGLTQQFDNLILRDLTK